MSYADEFWAEIVKYLPPRDLFEEITPEDAQAMLDVGEDATLTEEEISRFTAALLAGEAVRRAAQTGLPDEEAPPNIAQALLAAPIIILVAHPSAMPKLRKGSRGTREVGTGLVTGDTIRPGGPESWKLTMKDGDPDIPLPPEVASRCYGTPSQSVTLALHLVPVAGTTGRFGPQLIVSPAPTLDALIFDVTFPDGTEQTLTVPVPRGKRPTAHSQSYNPLPDTALGQGKWELTVSPR